MAQPGTPMGAVDRPRLREMVSEKISTKRDAGSGPSTQGDTEDVKPAAFDACR